MITITKGKRKVNSSVYERHNKHIMFVFVREDQNFVDFWMSVVVLWVAYTGLVCEFQMICANMMHHEMVQNG